jgi:DNA-binding HxlR family transcriptional regulator
MKKYNCHFELTLDIIGGKWKPLVILYIGLQGVMRYSDLRKEIPNINERMLSKQLKELVDYDIVNRVAFKEVPPRVEYSLTETGQTLMPILRKLYDWGVNYNSVKKIAEFEDLSNP